MALFIKTKTAKEPLTTRVVKPTNGKSFTLDEIRFMLGGNFEPVYLDAHNVGRAIVDEKGQDYKITNKTVMLVNEDGIMLKLPLNIAAVSITGQVILGNALLVEQGTELV